MTRGEADSPPKVEPSLHIAAHKASNVALQIARRDEANALICLVNHRQLDNGVDTESKSQVG